MKQQTSIDVQLDRLSDAEIEERLAGKKMAPDRRKHIEAYLEKRKTAGNLVAKPSKLKLWEIILVGSLSAVAMLTLVYTFLTR